VAYSEQIETIFGVWAHLWHVSAMKERPPSLLLSTSR
jgi:hypothetical protein